ncbi:MAG TPA: hypothetical protein VOA41_13125 [Candidatus Dormibacteraeota bacterium]|nr:hypothetical protein [Candidatus Dormibacteraeota bacterium]
MGSEAACTVRWGGKRAKGQAFLETEELLFRAGGGAFRLRIPFRAITSSKACAGELQIASPEGKSVFVLGGLAEKWAQKILHPKSLVDKLGVKVGALVHLVGVNEENLRKQLLERRCDIADGKPQKETDWIFLGVESREGLGKIRPLVKFLKNNGGFWIVYPKGQKHITENDVLVAGRQARLVDVKVVSVSPTYTALKFMIPRSRR